MDINNKMAPFKIDMKVKEAVNLDSLFWGDELVELDKKQVRSRRE